MHPSKITILLDEKKAMYLNHELEEVEYFNPKNTVGKIVFDIFNKGSLESVLLGNKVGTLISNSVE